MATVMELKKYGFNGSGGGIGFEAVRYICCFTLPQPVCRVIPRQVQMRLGLCTLLIECANSPLPQRRALKTSEYKVILLLAGFLAESFFTVSVLVR